MEDSRTEVKELVGLFDGLLGLLLDELVAVLTTEVFLHDIECFFMDTIVHRLANSKDHVKH